MQSEEARDQCDHHDHADDVKNIHSFLLRLITLERVRSPITTTSVTAVEQQQISVAEQQHVSTFSMGSVEVKRAQSRIVPISGRGHERAPQQHSDKLLASFSSLSTT
jgi:hypothetical protein